VGARYHAALRRFYEAPQARGKPKREDLTACRQKLLTSLLAVLRDQIPWQPTLLAT